MKDIFTVAIILLGYFNCIGQTDTLQSQTDTTKVPMIAYWSIGDTYDFKISKIKQKWEAGNLKSADTSAYIVNFMVADSTDSSYTIKWRYKTNLTEFNISEELVEKLSKYEFTEVIYTTSELGDYLGIENWEQISAMMKEIMGDVSNYYKDTSKIHDREKFDQAMQPFLNAFSSKEGIEQVLFKELSVFHFPFGVEYSVSQPLVYEDLIPNVFGGDPVRGDAKIYVHSVDFDKSHCVLKHEMKLNEEDMKKMIKDLLKKMKLNDKEVKKIFKTAKIDIQDHNNFEYFYNPGIPIRLESSRETVIIFDQENMKNVEQIIIELVED